jgi:hypothetical protein
MLIRHNGGGLRPAAAFLLAAALIACSSQAAAQPSPSTTPPAQSAAADLRTHLDLLLAEHVMIVAKESAAAINHADEYPAYTALLSVNATYVAASFGRAFGATAATQFAKSWEAQNGYLVDYAIRVASHDDDLASAAISRLTGTFAPQFGQMIESSARLPANAITELARQQVLADKAFIDDLASQNYATFYTDLDKAYTHTSQLGDVLARHAVAQYPDRFPGDPSAHAVDSRVTSNLSLQEHSYLTTMATDAAIAKRDADKSAAVSALGAARLGRTWSLWDSAVVAYATGGNLQGSRFVDDLASATGASAATTQFFIVATARVVDDQKSKNFKSLAGNDRAAATATQPIADSLAQG